MKIIGIDTETTGVTTHDKVLQVAVIVLDSETFETVERFSSLVNPQCPINPEAQKVHGISQQDVDGAPTFEELMHYSDFPKLLEGADIVFGHNVEFDLNMLGRDLFPKARVLDTLKLTRSIWRQPKNHKLTTITEFLQLPPRNAHDALEDIEACADIIRYLHNLVNLDIETLMVFQDKLKREVHQKIGRTLLQRGSR